jgi:hypothetical protein
VTVDVLAGSDYWIPFDFTDKVRSGSVVIDAEASVTVLTGDDPAPQDLVVGDPEVDGYTIWLRVQGTVANVTYCVVCTIGANKAGDLLPVVLKLSRRVRVTLPCAV